MPDTIQSFTYVPDPGFSGQDSFLWNASDGEDQASSDASVSIAINNISVDAGEDLQICEDESVTLSVVVRGGSNPTYNWSCNQPECGLEGNSSAEIRATPLQTTTYYVSVTDGNGMTTSGDTVLIEVEQCRGLPLSIPDAITPNGDNINDTWQITNIESYDSRVVEIFDRNGVRVFISEGYQQAWDGTRNGQSLPSGTYYFLIRLNDGAEVHRGSVSILK
jgi:gliding motility-associated-like protein